jgi:hypothetical protein
MRIVLYPMYSSCRCHVMLLWSSVSVVTHGAPNVLLRGTIVISGVICGVYDYVGSEYKTVYQSVSICCLRQVKVKVTLRPTVSQDVLVSSPIWDFWPDFFFFSKLLSCLFGAPSLTIGRVCHVSVFVIEVYNSQSLFTTNIYIKLKIDMCSTHLQYIQASFSPGSVQQIMPQLLVAYTTMTV